VNCAHALLALTCTLIAAGLLAHTGASYRAGTRPIVIAHRGASGYLPEHTNVSAAVAFSMGADFIEPDVVLSKDGTAVVLHDIHLDTVTNVKDLFPDRSRSDGRFYALDFTLDEIKRLRVSERIDVRTGKRVYPHRFPSDKADLRVPTLAELIELIQGLNHSMHRSIGIYAEIKQPAWHREQGTDIAKVVLSVLSRYGYRDRNSPCFVQCFDAAELKRIRTELKSDLRMIQLLGDDAWKNESGVVDESKMKAELAAVAEYAQGGGPDLRSLVRVNTEGVAVPNSAVGEAHRLGLLVHAYTFRRDALPEFTPTYEELVRLYVQVIGIDGLFTDFTDTTVELIDKFAPP